MMKSNTHILAKTCKPAQLLGTAAILLGCGLYSAPKAAPGFDVGGMTLAPFLDLSYGRVAYTNLPSYKRMVENSFSPTVISWKQDNIDRSADTINGSLGLNIGQYLSISTGASSNTMNYFRGTFQNTGGGGIASNKYSYYTRFYQVAKLAAGYPLLAGTYKIFASISENYEKINAKYEEQDISNNTSLTGKGSVSALLPGVGLGLLVNLPKTDNHLSLKFEYEFIRGKNASKHANLTSSIRTQLLNKIPSRNQFLIGLQYTV